uniref:Neuronal PAS domain protein 4 like n=1 Tax=Sinocyclocheilus grahami TaxID=75366 RepID=A0A672M1T9_SINGR
MSCDASVRRILRASKRVRSTKGASKARRDHINAEIRTLRSLLPISAEDQERLSYLHSMSLVCSFVRKSALLSGSACGLDPCVHKDPASLYHSFLQALPGFIVALSRDGKLVYVSENVQEYLGLSMVDVLQGDSFYDMTDGRDAEAVRVILREQDVSAGERFFVCRMHSSRALRLQNAAGCSMLVRGRFQAGPLDAALFVALCSPTVDRVKDSELLRASSCFQTLHRSDMRLQHAPCSVLFHLGFSAEELIGRSWYELLHPDDLALAAGCHRSLVAEMLVRLQRHDQSWIWLYVRATLDRARDVIVCTNLAVSEAEAVYLRDKLYSAAQTSQPACVPRDCDQLRRSSETSADSLPLFFCTPPYSPNSSHCSSDFLSEGSGALCPPQPSSDPISDLFSPALCPADAHLVPVYGTCEALEDFGVTGPDPAPGALCWPEPLLEPGSGALCPPQPSSDPISDLFSPALCPADAHLVPVYGTCEALEDFGVFVTPEPSPPAEGPLLYSETEQAEIGTLARQICSLASSFDAYSRTGPDPAPGALCWPEPLLEPVIHLLCSHTLMLFLIH